MSRDLTTADDQYIPVTRILKRVIPARTKTLIVASCKRDWMRMSPQFRAIRAKASQKMDKCGWCSHPFVDGEMMALALSNEGNKNLCQKCAGQLFEGEASHG